MFSVLLVTHQLDFSGAPHALLSASRALKNKGLSIDLYSLNEGPLESEFLLIGVNRVRFVAFQNYDLVLLNTAVLAKFAASIPESVRYCLWIHESPNLFMHSDVPFWVCRAAK